jgi:hypothetical protein
MPRGGGGAPGISSVTTNSTLTGAGTGASPLGVADWPLTYYSSSLSTSSQAVGGANNILGSTFLVTAPVTFANIIVQVSTADATHNSDIGIYTTAGTLLADIGAQALGSTGVHSFATVQGSQTLLPGLYIFAFVSAGTTFAIQSTFQVLSWLYASNLGFPSGGALPSSITAPTLAPVVGALFFGLH